VTRQLTATTVAAPADGGLPLRSDDTFGVALFAKTLFFTALLLAAAYFALRFYARRRGAAAEDTVRPRLRCETALRLSTRTKVYLVRAGEVEVLVTESTTGSQSLILGRSPTAPDEAAP
jgi:hypothetical protein